MENGFKTFEEEFNLPSHAIEFQNLILCDFRRKIGCDYDELAVNGL